MQHYPETTKVNLKNAITLFQKTKDRRISEIIEHLTNRLKTKSARSSILSFANYMYNDSYKTPAHIQLIAKHLHMVEKGELKRLAIFMPPRHGKSMLCSEFFPAWYLGNNPKDFIIQATYAQELADDFGRKVRNYVQSEEFNQVFPNVGLRSDSMSARRFHTVHGGTYAAVGAGGAITGRGAHLMVIDDPIKGREDAESEVQRRNLIEWYKSVAYTRLQPGGKIILIQTRWHQDDLAGYILNESGEDWKILDLPAVDASGNALWPDAYGIKELDKIKTTVGSRIWNALYQQKPAEEEGAILKRDWWKIYAEKELPVCSYIVQSYDTAFSTKASADYTACTTWGVFNVYDDNGIPSAACLMLDAWKERLEYPDLRKRARDSFFNYKPDEILIEKRASGQSLIQDLRRAGLPVVEFSPDKDKVSRAHSVAPMFEAGLVHILNDDFKSSVLEECAHFPYGKFDDIVDTVVQALMRIREGFLITHPDDPDDMMDRNARRYKETEKHYYS